MIAIRVLCLEKICLEKICFVFYTLMVILIDLFVKMLQGWLMVWLMIQWACRSSLLDLTSSFLLISSEGCLIQMTMFFWIKNTTTKLTQQSIRPLQGNGMAAISKKKRDEQMSISEMPKFFPLIIWVFKFNIFPLTFFVWKSFA